MKLQYPKAVIFDWDNTLVNTLDLITETLKRVWKEFKGTDFEVQYFSNSRSWKDVFPEVFGDRYIEASARFYYHYQMLQDGRVEPLEGAVTFLEQLNRDQRLIAIVSNKQRILLDEEMKYLRWYNYFDSIMGSGDVREDKPSPLPAIKTMELLRIQNPADVWFVGDSMVDVECARRSGCIPIYIGSDEALKEIQVKNHHELLSLYNKAKDENQE
ncbi:HAD family hydrolase [Rickettsiales endosymbiont of Peranema trichophorum]|uniref:HAD family hydrolase n=1 Tax=Rickettsiales endosymbiont of Peranema trichophorum TaxID=2486577 RepID=UPI001022E80E|nr:HAD hydrolase-like protein [Rickettsiales endosymbiont of Peranema trichophorum]RZI46020.1 HAD family hydrolase [Rickettsiales endosymbiont of Peranema trichophorum]